MEDQQIQLLPASPANITGWPWIEATSTLSETMPDGSLWPRISIVTPSYNQGQFIEKTIRSVLLQGYPNLEYIIIDGGSTDESVEIIRKYESWLTYWVSEQDRGQTHAINKGLAHCSGEVFNWLNSDDYLYPGALAEVGQLWRIRHSHLIAGRGIVIEAEDYHIVHDWSACPPTQPLDFITPHQVVLAQPSTFIALRTLRSVGGLREDLHYVMDWEFYLRLTTRLRDQLHTATTTALLACALHHPAAKTVQRPDLFRIEAIQVLRQILGLLDPREREMVETYIYHLHTQTLIVDLTISERVLYRLACLPFYRPAVLHSRFFWGAFRRAVVRNLTSLS